jgi:protein-disulfide isomerase
MKNNVWALLACTALGFIIGRELPRRGSSPGDGPDAAPPPTAKTTAAVAPEAPRPTPPAPPAPAAPRPSPNQKVELAKWTPVKGPNTAKVTIVEFSDFQ